MQLQVQMARPAMEGCTDNDRHEWYWGGGATTTTATSQPSAAAQPSITAALPQAGTWKLGVADWALCASNAGCYLAPRLVSFVQPYHPI